MTYVRPRVLAWVVASLLVPALLVTGCGDDTPDDPGPDAGGWDRQRPDRHHAPDLGLTAPACRSATTSRSRPRTRSRATWSPATGSTSCPVDSEDDELMHASADGVEGTGAVRRSRDPARLTGRALPGLHRPQHRSRGRLRHLRRHRGRGRSRAGRGDRAQRRRHGTVDTDLTDLYEDAGDPDILGHRRRHGVGVHPGRRPRLRSRHRRRHRALRRHHRGQDAAVVRRALPRGRPVEPEPHLGHRRRPDRGPARVPATGPWLRPAPGARPGRSSAGSTTRRRWGFGRPGPDPRRPRPNAESTLITCTVPHGACTPIPATTGVDVVLPSDSLR